MTEDTDPVSDGLRRAIAAADAANDAAEDIARLGKAQKEFVDKVGRAQKRSSALATGATVGAVVCLALSTLVYFRSVADLHEAAELQAEAAKMIAEEVLALKEARDDGKDHEDPVAKALADLPEAVAAAVAAKLSEPVEGEAAPTAGGDVVAAIEESRDEILAALAEMDLTGAAPAKPAEPAAEGAAPAAPALAVPGDLTDIRESLARIEAGVLRITAAPAAAPAAKAAPAKPASAPSAPAKSSAKSPAKPATKPAAEPNPFVYP